MTNSLKPKVIYTITLEFGGAYGCYSASIMLPKQLNQALPIKNKVITHKTV